MQRAASAVPVVLSMVVPVAVLAAQAVPGAGLEAIAVTGDPVPGVPGLRFDRFDAPPGVGNNRPPTLARDGEVAFHAFLGDGDPFTTEPGRGVFRGTPAGVATVARVGDPAPGTTATFVGLPGITDATPRIAAGTVATGGMLSDARIGVWRQPAGMPLEKAVLQGERLPGMPRDGRLFQMAYTLGTRGVLLNANWNDSGPPSLVKEGLWRLGTGSVEAVALGGMPAPGTSVVFGVGGGTFGPVHRWSASREGRLAFTGYLDGRHVGSDDDEGIWFEDGTGLRLLVREGGAVPVLNGMRWGSATGSNSFGRTNEDLAPRTNDRGDVLFGATMHGKQSVAAHGVFVLRAGALRHVATGQQVLPGNPPGDPAPGYGGRTFSHFVFGALNDTGGIAFLAAIAGSSFFDRDFAVYRDLAGPLELVAGADLPLPALPRVVATMVSLRALADSGAVYYSADLDGAAGPDRGLFAAPPTGDHRLLLRTGDEIRVEGEGLVVRDFRTGVGLDAGERLVVEIFFTDGTEGVFLLDPHPALMADTRTLPVSGGRAGFRLDFGRARAGRSYALLGSLSGTGRTVVGTTVLPVVVDAFTHAGLQGAGSPMFPGFLGVLDQEGRATAAFDSTGPLPAGAVGLTAHFAGVLLGPLAEPTNVVGVTVVR